MRVEGIGGNGSHLDEGVHMQLSAFADVRIGDGPFHLRAGLALGLPMWFTGQDSQPSATHWVRLRLLPLAVDLADWLTVRVGGDVGAQWIPSRRAAEGDGYVEWMPAVSGELVLRLLEGDVEVGAFGGMQFTGRNPSARHFDPIEQYVFGAQLAALFEG